MTSNTGIGILAAGSSGGPSLNTIARGGILCGTPLHFHILRPLPLSAAPTRLLAQQRLLLSLGLNLDASNRIAHGPAGEDRALIRGENLLCPLLSLLSLAPSAPLTPLALPLAPYHRPSSVIRPPSLTPITFTAHGVRRWRLPIAALSPFVLRALPVRLIQNTTRLGLS